MATVLMIDRDVLRREALASALETSAHAVHRASDRAQALGVLQSQKVDVVILEGSPEHGEVSELSSEIRRLNADCRILVHSGQGRRSR